MPMKQGESYSCPDPDCGCEITVVRGAQKSKGNHQHFCCCGREMNLKLK